ncbi:mucin-2-like isoform X2 [Entelurus aequoreus]|uniref:mucin-2-like isoform X2 n=1 Tax=Entelurus aequoreus TaxID=161455 RepID=UPI002B1DFE23|nr:mucin-2-like isoform X2 [Entelurus aequoreus]
MFRRSRFSVRPNVGGPGRTGAAPQEATPGGKEASQALKAISEGARLSTVDDSKPGDTPAAAPTALGDGNEPSGEASSAAVQRRKRFSVKPRVAPGRPSIVPRVPKSPAKLVPESPAKVSELESTTSNEVKSPAATPQAPSSPMPTADSKLPHVQPTFAPPEGCADALKEAPPLPDLGKQTEKSTNSSIKVPHRPLDKVSLPDREAAELSEKAKTLLSSKGKKSIARFSLSRLLNDPSDIQRLENAEKLRDLLRQEMRKEKGIKKRKKPVKEFSVDPTKMTMRDLIRYLPLSNPMSSSLEDDTEQNETVTPFTPRMEILPERAQEPEAEVVPAVVDQTEEEEQDVEGTGQGDEDDDDALMVPQVKVAEDGTLILDEESLTVEVQRAKGPNPAEDRDPIFERGSTTTYSSFRASTYCKPWSSEETDMFFLAISMVGTDFSMICQLFHNRTRSEIRNKFKKEEKQNSWRVDKAFRERRKLDIEYFSKLLEKILEVQQSRKKLKSLVVKNPPKKSQGKSKGRKRKKAAGKLSASEEEDEVEEDSLLCSEAEDGEKENEGGTLSSKVKKKLKSKVDASAAKPAKKKSKTSEKSSKEDEACVPEDTEAALPEDHPDSGVCESAETEKASNGATIKPAKLPRGSAAKSVGRKCSKKLPPSPTTAAEDGDGESAKQGESVKDDASKDQVNKEALPSREASDDDVDDSCSDEDSGDEDYAVKPAKPTRSGRIPKPTALLSYPAPSTRTAPKRDRTTKAPPAAPSSKKPKLVMLRATQSESSAEEDGQELEDEEMKELWCDGSTQAFVPASLRSPHAVICQVEEAVEELDILADMSVLDMSQDELCLNSSCERAQFETGSRETSAHQLDLLVDVIDLLSSEHAGVSEVESYNEAAQTLLAIGNVSHPSHSDTTQDQITGVPSDSGNETSRRLEEEIVAEFIEENTFTPIMSVPSDQEVTDAFETAPVGPTNTESSPHIGEETCCEQRHVSDHDLTRPLQSNTRTRIARSSKVKPKPNLAKASRAAHSRTQPETSSQGSTMESDSVAPDLSKDFSEEPSSKIAKCSQSSEKQTFDMDAKSTNAETSESTAFDTAVTETLAQEAGSDYVAIPVVHEDQNSSEPPSSRPTRTTTSKVEPQPTCTFSPKKISPSANSSSSETTTMSLSSNLVEEVASSEIAKCSQSSKKQTFEMDAKSTNAETSESAASDAAVTETLAQESDSDYVAIPVVHEDQNSSEHSSTRPTRITTSKVEPQPTCTFSPKKISPSANSSSSETTTMSLSSNLVEEVASSEIAKCSQSSKKQTFEMDAKSTNAETSESAASDAAVTETLAQESDSDYVAIPVVHEDQNSSEHLSSRPTRITTSKVEPQPTCTFSPKKISPSANFSSSETTTMSLSSNLVEELASSVMKNTCTGLANQLSSESKPTDAEKKKVECSPNEAAAFDDAVTEPLTQESNMHLIQKGEDNGAMIEVHEGLDSRELQSSPPFKRTRFHRVKPKPNLSQISKSARSKPQTTKETSDSSKLESTWTTTSMVKPQRTCTFSPTKTSPSANSASSVTTTMDVGPNLVPPEELTSGEIVTSTEHYEQLNIETKSTDAEQIEFGSNEEAAADDAVTEPLVQESSMPLIQKGGFNDNMPEAHEGQDSSELQSSPPFKRNRLRIVKPKPNLSQISKSARSKPQTTSETSDSSKLESTWTTTSMVKPQPTCTFSATKTSPSANSTSSVTTTMDVSSNLVPTEELASGEIVKSTEHYEQLNIETKSTDAEQIEFGSNEEAAADDAVTEPLVQESSMPLIQKGGFNDNMPEAHEGQDSSELQSSPPFKRNRLRIVKPKPNLSQISKSARSKPQTPSETSDSSKLESTWTTTTMVKPQPTCTFSATKTSPSANSTSSVTTTMDVSSNLVPTEELASGEIVKSTGNDEQLNIETKSTDAEQIEFGSNKEAAADDAATEPLAQESSMPLNQKGGFNDNMPEAYEGLDCRELQSSPPFKRNRFHRVKPKPNLSQISKSARSKPQATKETSDSSKLESTSAPTSMVKPQPTCTFSPEETSQCASSASSVLTTMNLSSNLVPTEELTFSEIETSTGCDDQLSSEPKSTDAEEIEYGANKEAASDDAVTEPLAQKSSMPLIQKCGFKDSMPEVHEGQNSSELQSSPLLKINRFQRVKPKPNLTQISKRTRSEPQVIEETSQSSKLESTWTTTSKVEPQPTCIFSPEKTSPSANFASSVTTTMNLSSNRVPTEELASSGMKNTSTRLANQLSSEPKPMDAEKKKVECSPNKEAASDDAVTEQLAQESSMPLVQECNNDSMPEVVEGQNSSELQSSQPFRKNRFHRFKPKPNLSHISKSARSKPQATNETSQSSKLESTWTTTSNFLPEEASPSADSASFVTTSMNFSTIQVSKEELSSAVKTSTGLSNQLSSEPKPTDGENIEFGPHKAAASGDAVTELLAQESNTCSIQESGGHDTLPEVNECQSSSEPPQFQPTKRSRFQRVKPKPNLSQISKSARSKPQITKETIMSTNLECTGKITSKVETQPTGTFSPEKPSPKDSVVTPSMDSSTSLVPREELTSSQEKKAVELAYQEESSLPVVDARKENTGVKEAIFGAANETVRFNAEVTQSSSNNVVPSDIIPECQVGVGANANKSTIHKVSNHLEKDSKSDLKCESSHDRSVEAASPSTSETSQSVTLPLEICLAYQPTEDLSSSRDKNEDADSEAPKHTTGTDQRQQCLPKVKPALRFPARAIRSTSQSKDGGESFNITSDCQVVEKKSAGPCLEIDEKVVVETEEKSKEEGYNAPCQDKMEDRTYLKSDDQNIAAAPSNTQLLRQDTVPEHSKTVQTNQMMTETQPLQSANDPPLPKTATTRRSRLVKPKPNLGKSGRQARLVAAKADSDAVRAPGSQEILPEPVQPVEGAIGLSAMECTTQDESSSSTGQEQTFASLSILQDVMSVPSDPDEPFFILSLTEIPVDTIEEVLNPTAQLPPFICDPNQSMQQSLAVENVIAGPDGSTPDVLVSTEETATTMTPAIGDPVAPPERHQGCVSAGPSSTASSPKRKPKGFLSFLSRTPSVAQSTRGKAASRRSRRKKPATTTHPPVETHLAAAELSSAPQRHLHANDDALVVSSHVSACEHDDGEAVQQEPSDVSQFFLSDIFTEV